MSQVPIGSRNLGHEWGRLFKKFYGEPLWRDYLSRSAGSYRPELLKEGYMSADGKFITSEELAKAETGSVRHELAILIYSDSIYKWSDICGSTPRSIFEGVAGMSLPNGEFLEVDTMRTGCKFDIDVVKGFLNYDEMEKDSEKELHAEHTWALSNATGTLMDASHVEKFKTILFKDNTNLDITDNIHNVYGDYLSYLIELYKRHVIISHDELNLRRDFISYVIDYLNAYDFGYADYSDNPLITGFLLDFMIHNRVYTSTYSVNLSNLRLFISKVLPVMLDTWVIATPKIIKDERLCIPISAVELVSSLPSLNLYDRTVLVGDKLMSLEYRFEYEAIESMVDKVKATLLESNKLSGVSELHLFDTFYVYYAVFCTAKERTIRRPAQYMLYKGESVSMEEVEDLFDSLQKASYDVNVRRCVLGAMGDRGFECYKRLGLRFPPKSDYVVPDHMAYLNVDFYKQLDESVLTPEESHHLSNIRRRVDVKCNNLVSLKKTVFKDSSSSFSNVVKYPNSARTKKVAYSRIPRSVRNNGSI
ncbi:CPh [Strawberry chlorotic fleck-associated virus]|uniref:CPh n=1 Tax=Strawberry chlorotic fleck-associated virus TaxID=399314 RepID=Q0GK50_9CLOS|nr:CPh [Strawberry chlorotic fleck-associated virus]ABI23186.1 CPh [Strawberry chlorotic fleck-associated virus]QZN83658.1 CPh [Strawberry chlorotic fleck-associated virus]